MILTHEKKIAKKLYKVALKNYEEANSVSPNKFGFYITMDNKFLKLEETISWIKGKMNSM